MKSRLLSILLMLVICYTVLETGTCLLIKNNRLQGDVPSFDFEKIGTRFWVEVPTPFGVWHRPDFRFHHRKSCFEVDYQTNTEGMRDKPRERNSDRPRTVMLGDSFIEGWGVAAGDRVSDLLEKETGREFLNFGTAGYVGPIFHYFLYKNLGANFSHDEVVVGILPNNDFNDDDYEARKDKGRYRPFWVGKYPDYRLVYTPLPQGMTTWNRYLTGFFREFSFSYNAVKFLIMDRQQKARDVPAPGGTEFFSKFYDFSEAEYQRMEYSLDKLRKAAQGKKFSLFLIPVLNDLKRYDPSGKAPLAKRLEAWGLGHDAQVIDLLPWMHDYTRDWEKYYFPCDEHWSTYGNQVAFEYLKTKLPVR